MTLAETKQTVSPEPDEDGDVFYDSNEYTPEEFEVQQRNKERERDLHNTQVARENSSIPFFFFKALAKEAQEYKQAGNVLFAKAKYEEAIEKYENALVACPASQTKERAVYFGNIAACYLKLVNETKSFAR